MPISLSTLSDQELVDFLSNPSTYIKNPANAGKIFELDPNAKARYGSVLKSQGLSDAEIKQRLDLASMVRVTEIDVVS